jgi:hypothetical protein
MKTPMQEFIEVLKIHRDTAFEKAEHFKSHDAEGLYKWYDFRGQTLDDVISFAEVQIEKEKEFMQKVYANAKATGEMDEAVRTFNN